MTRQRRRKIRTITKYVILLSLPFGIAGSASGVKGLKTALSGTNGFFTEKTPSAAVPAEDNDDRTVYTKETPENDPDDILCGSLILSEGYGVTAETAEDPVLKLQSPLEMTADDPGEKLYPTEDQWTKGGEIIRTTYTPYSGTTFIDLENGGQVNNKTDISNDTLIKESRYLPDFTIEDTAEPQVLI